MTPKEKAKELFMDMKYHIPYVHDPTEPSEDKIAKECALIAVDEIIKAFYLNTGSDIVGNHIINFAIRESDYWQEVKQEIEKL